MTDVLTRRESLDTQTPGMFMHRKTMGKHSKKVPIYKLRRETTEKKSPADTLTLHFALLTSRTGDNFCHLSHPVLWYFVMIALANKYN